MSHGPAPTRVLIGYTGADALRELRPIGSKAMLEDIQVWITSTMLRPGPRVLYEVAWLANGERKEALVEEFELSDLQ